MTGIPFGFGDFEGKVGKAKDAKSSAKRCPRRPKGSGTGRESAVVLDFPEEQVAVAGIRGPLRLEDILFVAKKSNRIAPLQAVRADLVVGVDHVRSAAMHAQRAQRQGRMHANSVEVEFVRYLAGERQIRAALDKVGLPDGAASAAVVAFGPKRTDALQHFLHSLAPKQDDKVLEAAESKLVQFGITSKALQATTPARRMDLVLEAVASVDLLR